jgi:hypothetical protein
MWRKYTEVCQKFSCTEAHRTGPMVHQTECAERLSIWLVTRTIPSWISTDIDFGWESVWLPVHEKWWLHEWMQNKSFWCHLPASAHTPEIAVPDRPGSRGTECVDAVNQSDPIKLVLIGWRTKLVRLLSRLVFQRGCKCTSISWRIGPSVRCTGPSEFNGYILISTVQLMRRRSGGVSA